MRLHLVYTWGVFQLCSVCLSTWFSHLLWSLSLYCMSLQFRLFFFFFFQMEIFTQLVCNGYFLSNLIQKLCIHGVYHDFNGSPFKLLPQAEVQSLNRRWSLWIRDELDLSTARKRSCLSESWNDLMLFSSRLAQCGTPWPSLCTAPCSTGSCSGSIMRCSTHGIWRSPPRWAKESRLQTHYVCHRNVQIQTLKTGLRFWLRPLANVIS